MEDNGWKLVRASIGDEQSVRSIRDSLFTLCSRDKYRKIDPHITLIPPFELEDTEKYTQLNEYIDTLNTENLTFTVNGASVYPSLNNPRVVLLDITPSDKLKQVREKVLNWIQQQNVTFWYEPTPLHITLFKCDNGYTLAEDKKEFLQRSIWNQRESWTDTIEYIDLICTVSE